MKMFTGKSAKEIITFVESHVISYEDFKKFYLKFERFPTDEANFEEVKNEED